MKEKVLWIINAALILTAVFLVLHLFEVELPTLGKAQYWLDESEPVCVVGFEEHRSLLDVDSCCSELQKQLRCVDWQEDEKVGEEELKVNKRCYTGKGAVDYFVNLKTFNYCKNKGFI